LLALDLLAAHRDSFAQGRRRKSKKRKLDDDADYLEPTEEHSSKPESSGADEEDTLWKKSMGRRGSNRRMKGTSTPTGPTAQCKGRWKSKTQEKEGGEKEDVDNTDVGQPLPSS